MCKFTTRIHNFVTRDEARAIRCPDTCQLGGRTGDFLPFGSQPDPRSDDRVATREQRRASSDEGWANERASERGSGLA